MVPMALLLALVLAVVGLAAAQVEKKQAALCWVEVA